MSKRLIMRLLERDEGVRLEPYRDGRGFWTVGVGHLIDRRRGGSLPAWVRPSFPLTLEEVDELLLADVRDHEADLARLLPEYALLDEVRQTVLLSMTFQLGAAGLALFRNTLAAVREHRWDDAADEMRDSDWWRRTTVRAERLAKAMATGDAAALRLGTS